MGAEPGGTEEGSSGRHFVGGNDTPQQAVERALRDAASDLERRAGMFKHEASDKVRRQTHNDIAKWLRARAAAVAVPPAAVEGTCTASPVPGHTCLLPAHDAGSHAVHDGAHPYEDCDLCHPAWVRLAVEFGWSMQRLAGEVVRLRAAAVPPAAAVNDQYAHDTAGCCGDGENAWPGPCPVHGVTHPAVPPAAGPDDGLRAFVEDLATYGGRFDAHPTVAGHYEPVPVGYLDGIKNRLIEEARAVLAAVPSAGLPTTPPEATTLAQGGSRWSAFGVGVLAIGQTVHVDGTTVVDADGARLLAATLVAAADVAEGGAQ
jgi:hypothetical protein